MKLTKRKINLSNSNSREIEKPQKKKSVGSRLITALLILVFVMGLAILLYPTVSNLWNSRVQSHAIVNYQTAVAQLSQQDYSEVFAEADKYNAALCDIDYPLMYHDSLREREDILPYEDILSVNDSGIIGYITIESVGVKLPFYHGTSDGVLNTAVGHLEGTSLPVGGESTHSVLSAHRGLPSAVLFSDLDKLQEGDRFTLSVLDRTLVYEVFDISVVEPDEVDSIYISEGEDLCTLLTCTPYGINTHRLLVTGRRIEQELPANAYFDNAERQTIDRQTLVSVIAAVLSIVLLLVFTLRPSKKSRKGKSHE